MICKTCLRTRLAQRLSQTAAAPAGRLSLSLQSLASSRRPAAAAAAIAAQSPLQHTIPPHQAQSRQLFSASPSPSYSTTPASATPEQPSPSSQQESSAALPKPEDLTEGEAQVWDILVAEFAPTQLLVQDISGGCGSMYGIDIASEKFRGINMLKQQRLVNAALGPLVREWHGVQLKTRAP